CHLLAPQIGDNELLKSALGKLALPNVWFDLAALAANQKPETYPYPTAVKHLQTAKTVVGAERLMFGSDMPSTLCRDTYSNLVNYIVESGVFTDAELTQVFCDTAEGVYFK
ncbi:MAG: amidohydrolase, partial [Clostridia bacterium]|nr:amidohydrolase [Clostridia bacterium]